MEKRGRGRPPFKPTAHQRATVAIAAGGGMALNEIAMGLGITRETLHKHFEIELSTGAHAKRLEVIRAMHAAAKRGNVAAAKAYMLLEPASAAPPLPPPAPAPAKEEPLGKKDQANRDAVDASKGTGWEGLLQ
jgi:hypothetical protein